MAAGRCKSTRAISASSLSDSEATTLNVTGGPAVTTTGDQSYSGAVTLSQDTGLTATALELAGVTGGNKSLTLSNSALATLGGAISGVTVLTVNGSGTLQVNAAISASSLGDSEATTLNVAGSPAVITTGDQSYSGAVTLSQATTLNSTTIELTGGVKFTGNNLTLNNSGQATVGGNFTAFNRLTFAGPLALGANTTLTGTTYSLPAVTGNNYKLTLTNDGAATLGGAISGVNVLAINGGGTLQVNAAISASSLSDSEATTLNVTGSPAVTTTGDQSYSEAVRLSQDTGLTATTLELAGVTGGNKSLTLTNGALATLGGVISGVNVLTVNGGGTLQVNAAISASSLSDSEATTLNVTSSPAVTTTGDQSYSGAVTLSQDTGLAATTLELAGVTGGSKSLTLTNSALATLDGAVSGVNVLTVNGGGTLQVNAAISASSLSDSETTTLSVTGSPAVTTTGDQSYSAAVTLSQDTGLAATTLELAGVTGGNKSLTLTNGALATLDGAISGVNVLTANGGGTLQLNAAISASSLSDSEVTTLNVTGSPAVTTTGDQSYSGAVTLSQDTGLTATTLELAAVTGGSKSLTLSNSALATLGGVISGVNVLTVNGGGTLQVNAAISASSLSDSEATAFNVTSGPAVATTGDQNYSGAVTLSQNTGLTATTLELAGVTGGSKSLTLTNGALATLGGAISGVNVLTVNGGGTLQVNAAISAASLSDSEATTLNVTSSPAVTTTGDQSYSGAVTLSQDTGLTASTLELAGVTGREQQPDAHQRCVGDAGRGNQRRERADGQWRGNVASGCRDFGIGAGRQRSHDVERDGRPGGDHDRGPSYSGAVTLSQATTLNSATIGLGPVNGPFSFIVNAGSGAADFHGSLNSASITVTAGPVTFSQPVTTTGGGATITNSGPSRCKAWTSAVPFFSKAGAAFLLRARSPPAARVLPLPIRSL